VEVGSTLLGIAFMNKFAAALGIWWCAQFNAPAAYSNEWIHMKEITPQKYVCQRTAKPLEIDGRLDEPAWQGAPWTADFVDIQGAAKPKPRFRTHAKMLWDDAYFYIAAQLEEPHVWATLTNHDAVIFQDPDFEIFIDPNGDNHQYYEIEINALNTEWDLRLRKPYKDGGPALNEWEMPGLKTGVQVNGTINRALDQDQGWTVEIAFPWRALAEFAGTPCPPKEGDQWRVDFSRVEWQIQINDGTYKKVPKTPEDNWVWSPTGIIDMHRPERWGFVQFTHSTEPGTGFNENSANQVKDRLMEIYYAQRAFFERKKHWAKSLKELELSEGPAEITATVRLTPDGYEAAAHTAGGKTWRIRQDSLLTE